MVSTSLTVSTGNLFYSEFVCRLKECSSAGAFTSNSGSRAIWGYWTAFEVGGLSISTLFFFFFFFFLPMVDPSDFCNYDRSLSAVFSNY